jgi:hypothetical protein
VDPVAPHPTLMSEIPGASSCHWHGLVEHNQHHLLVTSLACLAEPGLKKDLADRPTLPSREA